MSPRIVLCLPEISKSIIVVDLHISFTHASGLPRSHMLIVFASSNMRLILK